MIGLCECGCGGETSLAKQTDTRLRRVKGKPVRFLVGHANKGKKFGKRPGNYAHGPSHYRWKGGRKMGIRGYVLVLCRDHPRASPDGYVFEHILVAEKALGRLLPEGAVLHHVNEDRADNRPENLVICQDRAYHNGLHQRMRARAACGHADWRKCSFCGEWDDPENMYVWPNVPRGHHRECNQQHQRERRAKRKESVQ